MKPLIILFLLCASFLGAVQGAPPPGEVPRGTCYVCKYNNDLACVHFRLKPETPTITYGGRTYAFCSADCCKAFSKNPKKFVPPSGH